LGEVCWNFLLAFADEMLLSVQRANLSNGCLKVAERGASGDWELR
jgi:hypothetical protein